MNRWFILAASIILIVSLSLATYLVLTSMPSNSEPASYSYSVVNTYPHDSTAFTEGLMYQDGTLYESTGLVGDSSLRKVALETGAILQEVSLDDDYFGEGITMFGDRIIQLTWRSHSGFVYDKASFNVTEEFSYNGEGWGITNDGTRLIVSNGSSTLTFMDPFTFNIVGTVRVYNGSVPVSNLNELEYVNGDVYANVWHQDRIAIINIQTGQVKGWINLAGLYHASNADSEDVLNGIAYDTSSNRLFVTGKRWSQLFEIKLKPAP